jgi:DNA-binding transcriptional LysR family regulator
MRVAQATDEQFTQLVARTKGRTSELSGELVITSLEGAANELLPALNIFQAQYPDVIVRYITSDRVFKLEYGEAHIAIRAGAKPNEPDNVVQPFAQHKVGLYASKTYVRRHGLPNDIADFDNHRFVGPNNPDIAAPFFIWMRNNIPENQVTLRSTSQRVLEQAVISGTGIGFLPSVKAEELGMSEVMAPMENWQNTYWLVTHVDLHRTSKVQAFLKILKDYRQACMHTDV